MSNTPPMPGLEFPNIQERIVTYESARRIIDWGHRGWIVADALRTQVKTLQDGCVCTDKSKAEVLAVRSRLAYLEAYILRNADPYDMNEADTATFHEIGKRLVPQNY